MSSNTNLGPTPVNQGYVQLIHTGETGGIDGTLRTLYDGDGTASDLQIASNKVKVSTQLYIGSDTLQEYIQDTVGAMLVTNASHTNLSAAYDDAGDGAIDLTASGEVTLTGTQTLTNKTLASPTFTGTATGADLTLSGDLTVNGTTIAVDQTNLNVSDNIIGLNRGVSSNANDSGLIIERGSTGNNVFIGWDESLDRVRFATTTADASSTGNLSLTNANIHAGRLYADVTGDLTGDVTGNVTGNLTGNVTGDVTGNADTATTLATARNFSLTGDVTAGAVSFDGSGNVALSTTIAANSVALGTDTTGNYVGTITAGSGVSTSGASTGEGIAHNLSINASQTAITSIYNSSLQVGSAADEQRIDFGTSDEIRLGSSTQTSVKIKTDPLGSAQDEVIIGDGTADVDFVVDNSSGTTIFKVDAGTGNTAVTGDLSISGSFNPSTVTASTSVRTPLIEFTDGDDAISIANGGAMTFAKGFSVTSGASSFGANVDIKNSGGSILQLNTSSTDVDLLGVLGRINFSAPDESAGGDSNLLAASIIAKASADFTATSNQTDMVFELGVSETASEKFRIFSSGGIKIGNAYTLPSSDGSANQILKTNGSGTLSFADESGGAVSAVANGANDRIATFTSSDAIRGESNLTFDGSTLALTGDLNVDSNTLFVDSSADSVGIGTNSPERKFHVTSGSIVSSVFKGTNGTGHLIDIVSDSATDGYNGFRFYETTNFRMALSHIQTGTRGYMQIGNTWASGSEILVVDGDNSRVGIGTISPATNLEVKSTGNTTARISTDGDSGDVATLQLYRNSAAYAQMHYEAGGGANAGFHITDFRDDANSHIIFNTRGDNERMRIEGDGSVGIGTTSPGAYLHTEGASSGTESYAKFSTGSAAGDQILTVKSSSSRNHMALQVNTGAGATDDLALNPDGGNVGIGTTTPSRTLDVDGIIRSNTAGGRFEAISGTSGTGYYIFGDSGDLDIGWISYEHTNNAMAFKVNASERMRIDSSGNVGIGTSSPSTKLEVASGNSGGDAALDSPTIRINNTTASGDWDSGDVIGTLEWYASDTSGNAPYVTSYIKSVNEQGNGTLPSGALTFGTSAYNVVGGATEAMRIDDGGNVGIGTTTPAEKIDVNGNIRIGNGGGLFAEHSSASLGGTVIHPNGGTYRTNSSPLTGAIKITLPTGTGTIADMISFWVDIFDYATDESLTCYIAGYAYQTAGSNEWVNEEALMLSANQNRDFTVRFGHDGSNHCVYIGELTSSWGYPQITVRNVQVGYSSDVDTYNDGWSIGFESSAFQNVDETQTDNFPYAKGLKSSSNMGAYIDGNEKFRFTTGGAFHASDDVVAFSTTPSDIKLKTNVKDIEYGLDTIMKLKPKQYDWKKDNRKDIGFIAQEVEEVIPEIVKDNEWFDDKIKTLDYEKLTAVLIKAVQEQQKQIEELKNG